MGLVNVEKVEAQKQHEKSWFKRHFPKLAAATAATGALVVSTSSMAFIEAADVTSATALSAAAKEEVVAIVKKELGANEVIVNEKVDQRLIGGFILKVGDKQFDASIASGLSKLKKEFAQ